MKIPPCITLIRQTADDQARATETRMGFLGRLIRSTTESLIRWYPPLQFYADPVIRGLTSFLPPIARVYEAADRYCESGLKKDDWEKVKKGAPR